MYEKLTAEQYGEVLGDIHAIAANPGPDRDLALALITRLALLDRIEKRLRVSPARVVIVFLLTFAGELLAWERTHDRMISWACSFLVALCTTLILRPWRYR